MAPEILPAGRVRLEAVWVNGEPHDGFDPDTLTVTLPPTNEELRVRVRLAPVNLKDNLLRTTTASGAREP